MARLVVAGTDAEARRLALAVRASPATTLLGCVASTIGDAEDLAAELAVTPANPATLPRRTQGVVVSSAVASRADWAAGWAAAGVAVLVGSPIAATVADADRIIDAVSLHGSLCGVAEPTLFAPPVVAGIERVARLGELRHLEVRGGVAETDDDPDAAFRRVGAAALALLLALGDAGRVELEHVEHRPRRWSAAVRRDGRGVGEITIDITGSHDMLWAQAAGAERTLRVEVWPDSTTELDGEAVVAPHGLDPDDPVSRLRLAGYRGMIDGFAGAIDGRGGALCPLGFGRRVVELAGG